MLKLFSSRLKEEIIIPLVIFAALAISISPFLYELSAVQKLPPDRYPLFESDFAPDMRVYLSRMQQGYDGHWLVYEKYTSEPHQPSILHISYLLMGKITGVLGITPFQAFPIWKLLSGAFFLASGYYCLSVFLPRIKPRLLAFFIFVFVGNFPILAQNSIPVFGLDFATYLSWYTFFDPVKRIVFLPHYTLSAGFFFLAASFTSRAFQKYRLTDFLKSGLLFFLAGMVLPTTLFVAVLALLLFVLSKAVTTLLNKQFLNWFKTFLFSSWPVWLWLFAGLAIMKLSFSYFPWSIQSLADLEKRNFAFDWLEMLLAIGPTAILGLVGSLYILLKAKQAHFLPVFWLLGFILLVLLFFVFPFSSPNRPFQVDLHLPLAITSVVLIDGFLSLFKHPHIKKLILTLILLLLSIPAFLVWSTSLKGQTMFVDTKLAAVSGSLLIPQLPYVVYPARSVMEAIFWLRDHTDHQDAVLAAETLGSMIPAYAGNFVYLGHGSQTVYFQEKMALMRKFYQGQMSNSKEMNFLKTARISYVFYGPEEADLGQINPQDSFLKLVYNNPNVSIYRVSLTRDLE